MANHGPVETGGFIPRATPRPKLMRRRQNGGVLISSWRARVRLTGTRRRAWPWPPLASTAPAGCSIWAATCAATSQAAPRTWRRPAEGCGVCGALDGCRAAAAAAAAAAQTAGVIRISGGGSAGGSGGAAGGDAGRGEGKGRAVCRGCLCSYRPLLPRRTRMEGTKRPPGMAVPAPMDMRKT